MLRKHWRSSVLLGLGVVLGFILARLSFEPAAAGDKGGPIGKGNGPKPATEATKKANAAFAKTLPFADRRDFEYAKTGLIAPLPDGGVVKNDKGQVVAECTTTGFGIIGLLVAESMRETCVDQYQQKGLHQATAAAAPQPAPSTGQAKPK